MVVMLIPSSVLPSYPILDRAGKGAKRKKTLCVFSGSLLLLKAVLPRLDVFLAAYVEDSVSLHRIYPWGGPVVPYHCRRVFRFLLVFRLSASLVDKMAAL